jgi:predicted ATPase
VVQAIRGEFTELAQTRPELVGYHAGEAGLAELATEAWGRASERALARAANGEALVHIQEGLRQLARLPEGNERHEKELAFELARGPALMAVKGFAAPEVKATYGRAQDLCQMLGDPSRVYSVLWGLWAHWFVAGELQPAREFAEQVVNIAETTGEKSLLVPAYHALGYTLFYMAEFERSLELARRGLALFDLEMERRNTRLFQFSSSIALHHFAANSLWMLGYPEQARLEGERAVQLGLTLGHPPSLAYAKSALTGGAPLMRRDYDVVDAMAVEATELFGDETSQWPPLVKTFQGWTRVVAGDVGPGLAQMQQHFAFYRSIGGGVLRTTVGALKAEATWMAGDGEGALAIISQTFADLKTTRERTYEPELHRVRGEVLGGSAASAGDAEESFRAAIALAREQGARSLELRAAVALTRFLQRRGRETEGMPLVRSLYDLFTEGFDTRDLREARALIAGHDGIDEERPLAS